ncbi:MAG: PH domain-containing protein [Bacteroidales bacterium]|nr:PH domain-containing protein [Bacteroidales bacterium]
MVRTFKSKIDRWYHLLVWIILGLVFYSFWQRYVAFGIVMLIVFMFLVETLIHTEYIIDADGYLRVQSGFLPSYKINMADIEQIKYIRNNRIAYALSFERLQIITPYANRMLSPENPEEFIKEIRKYNHMIIVTK